MVNKCWTKKKEEDESFLFLSVLILLSLQHPINNTKKKLYDKVHCTALLS